MRRILLYAVLAAAALMIPSGSVQLGKMKPVELIILRENAGQIELQTDTGDSGVGACVSQALADLKETTTGIIYLDTAVYLLVSEDTQHLIPELKSYLKEKVYIAQVVGEVEPEKAADFLTVHEPSVRLKDWEEGVILQEIRQENEKMNLEEKNEKTLDKVK